MSGGRWDEASSGHWHQHQPLLRCNDALGYGEPVVTRVRKDLVPVLGHSDDRPGPGGNRLSRMEIRVPGGAL